MATRVKDFQASDFQGTEYVDLLVSKPYAGSFEGVVEPQTLSPSAAVAAGADAIDLDAVLTDPILPRTELKFGAVTVIVNELALAGAMTISIEPAPAGIPDTAEALFSNLFPVYSLTQVNDSMNTDVIEDRVFRSGFWKSCRTTSGKLELQMQGKVIKKDPGLKHVLEAGRSGMKVFFKVLSEVGDMGLSGWAFPMNPGVNRPLDQNQDISFNLSVDGKPIFAEIV